MRVLRSNTAVRRARGAIVRQDKSARWIYTRQREGCSVDV